MRMIQQILLQVFETHIWFEQQVNINEEPPPNNYDPCRHVFFNPRDDPYSGLFASTVPFSSRLASSSIETAIDPLAIGSVAREESPFTPPHALLGMAGVPTLPEGASEKKCQSQQQSP